MADKQYLLSKSANLLEDVRMYKLVIMAVVVALLSGCGGTTVRDVSTGEDTVVIEGWSEFWSGCKIFGPLPVVSGGKGFVDGARSRRMGDSMAYGSVGNDSLIVDAGPVYIMVACSVDNPFGRRKTERATFNFTAEGGHTYAIVWKQGCIQLLDATADGSIVACEPSYSGGYEDLSTTGETASIRAGEASSDKGNCRPFTGERQKWGRNIREFIKVDAGPVSINARCFSTFFGRPESTARFEFVAEAGHNYTFTATEKDCISLLDITSQETEIACEPYKKDE
jgi:hypothetical protein